MLGLYLTRLCKTLSRFIQCSASARRCGAVVALVGLWGAAVLLLLLLLHLAALVPPGALCHSRGLQEMWMGRVGALHGAGPGWDSAPPPPAIRFPSRALVGNVDFGPYGPSFVLLLFA